jgi:mannose-1-phosphate guanylyltransferase/mannose-6-phosphate isomerase
MSRRIIPSIMCGAPAPGCGDRRGGAAEAIPAAVRATLDLPGHHDPGRDAALFDRPIVIAGVAYHFIKREQLTGIGLDAEILLEPARLNSGPAISPGAAYAKRVTWTRLCRRWPPTT